MKFNITTAVPDGFMHWQAFNEVKESMGWALSALGHEVSTTQNWFSETKEINVVFGAELIAPFQRLPKNSVIVQLEQSSHPNFNTVIKHLAKSLPIWDFSVRNVEMWQKEGYQAHHVPIGFTPNLVRVPKATTQDFDACFFGWMTQRRVELINAMRAAGLRVFASTCCYGGARDEIISRSKVCLDVHHDGRTNFCIVRNSYLMANSKCIVTEISDDDAEYDYLSNGLARCDYRSLLDTVKSYVQSSASHERQLMEEAAFQKIEAVPFTQVVGWALEQTQFASTSSPQSPISRAVERFQQKRDYLEEARQLDVKLHEGKAHDPRVQARYDKACREGDMKDFAPYLRKIAKGKILEIGVRDGASTSAFLMGLEDKGEGRIDSVDIADCGHIFEGHPLWSFTKVDSGDLEIPSESYDIILIDGEHTREGYKRDLETAWYVCKPGGAILSHDIVTKEGWTLEEHPGSDLPSRYIRDEYIAFAERMRAERQDLETWPGLGVLIKPIVQEVEKVS